MKSSATVLAGKPAGALQAPLPLPWAGFAARAPSWAGYARALVCFAALSWVALPAWAVEPEKSAPVTPQLAPGQPLQVEGARGVWWPLETAQVLTQEHVQLRAITELSRLQAQKVTLLEERLALRDQIDVSASRQIEVLSATLDGCSEREAVQVLRALKAEERLSNARWIWAAIGAGVVAVLVGGAWGLTASL